MKQSIKQNLILVIMTLMTLMLAFFIGLGITMPSVVALEQDARCGITEHVHKHDCYLNNVLICGEKAHTHGENCYLLRLEDNDINRLLSEIEADEEKSLEHVITNVVYEASYLELVSEGLLPAPTPTPTPTPTPLLELLPVGSSLDSLTATNEGVANLNRSIVDNNITPTIYLNERLITPASAGEEVTPDKNLVNLIEVETSPTDLVLFAAGGSTGSGGISTLAVGDSAATQGDYVNFYIKLDDGLKCIGHEQLLEVDIQSWQGSATTYYCTTRADTAEKYNDGLISNITADNISYNNNGTYYLRYTTSNPSNANSFNSGTAQRPGYNGNNNYLNFGQNDGLKYAILTTRSGRYNNYTYTAVQFYTVTIDYSNDSTATDQVQYVQNGLDSTLTFNTDTYDYYTDDEYSGTALTANELRAELSDIDSKTTIYARPKGYTVTFNSNGGSYTPKTQTLSKDGTQKATRPEDPTMEGHTFGGWFTDNGTFKNEYTFTEAVGSNITLYAKWTANTYYVKYDGNGTTEGTMSNSTHTYNVAKNLSANTYTMPGHTFTGWNTAANGSGTSYTDQQSVTNLTTVNGATITLYAQWESTKYTVNFNSNGGSAVTSQTVEYGKTATEPAKPTWAGGSFVGWYTDSALTQPYDFSTPVTSNITLHAKWNKYNFTITYYGKDGTTILKTDTKQYGESYTVSCPLPDGCKAWADKDGSASYSNGDTFVVTHSYDLQAADYYTVTYVDLNGNVSTSQVAPGTNVTLTSPGTGAIWVDDNGNRYNSGANVVINGNITFTAVKVLTVNYSVDPDGTVDVLQDGNTTHPELSPGKPTVSGTSSETFSTEVVPGENAVLRTATPNLVTALARDGSKTKFGTNLGYRVAGYFVGWEVESTGEILPGNATYSYAELSAYDTNNDGVVNLNGVWHEGWDHTLNFFIHNESLPSASTNPGEYTNALFTTYVDFPYQSPYTTNKYAYAEGTDDASIIVADAKIRASVGINASDVWFYDFPTDEEIFAKLKEYVTAGATLKVENVDVPVASLNADTYAIRWYLCQYLSAYNNYEDNSGWHINGKLVHKVGKIHVTKTFDGRADYIAAAKNGFTITATHGSDKRQLGLFASTDNGADGGYISEMSDPANNYYVWEISDVQAGEEWTITENLVKISEGLSVGEWLIVDSTNNQSNSGIGTQTTVTGVTFPKDVSSDEWLRADFTNIYHSENTLLIRKVDGSTGARIDGAVFELWQHDKKMTFDKEDGQYVFNTEGKGAYTQLVADGTEIDTKHFTYGAGVITVKEISAPPGYNKGGDVTIGYLNGNDGEIGITNASVSQSYATYINGLLIIKNFADTVDVTAKKEWFNCESDQWADSVRVQLYANGSASLAAQLAGEDSNGNPIPTVVTLNAIKSGNVNVGYETYTWKDLPAYAAGSKVTWSLKEIRIGNEEIKEDGTFPNWLSFPGVAVEGTDSYGKTVYTITVSNTPKSGAELMLLKTDMAETTALAGAEFTLTNLSDPTFIAKTGVTDGSGRLLFSGLKFDTVYTITEITAPDGYWLNEESFTVSISSDNGMVTVTSANGLAETGATAFSVRVKNLSAEPLPETGGTGTHIYTAGGLLLMAAATALLIYRRKRRKEADLLDV